MLLLYVSINPIASLRLARKPRGLGSCCSKRVDAMEGGGTKLRDLRGVCLVAGKWRNDSPRGGLSDERIVAESLLSSAPDSNARDFGEVWKHRPRLRSCYRKPTLRQSGQCPRLNAHDTRRGPILCVEHRDLGVTGIRSARCSSRSMLSRTCSRIASRSLKSDLASRSHVVDASSK